MALSPSQPCDVSSSSSSSSEIYNICKAFSVLQEPSHEGFPALSHWHTHQILDQRDELHFRGARQLGGAALEEGSNFTVETLLGDRRQELPSICARNIAQSLDAAGVRRCARLSALVH